MSTRPQPTHGTRARYLRGCRCTPCTDAAYHYMSRIRLDHERGQRRRIPAEPTRDHVKNLCTAGWTLTQIATAAGCSRHTISSLVSHSTHNVRRDIGAAILAIPVTQTPSPARDVDATGTVRRLRALVAIGWPLATVAPAAGLHRDQIARISRGGEPHVRAATADAVAAVYRSWCSRPGPSARARTTAARRGWHGPLAWDDIDDPNAEPEAPHTETYTPREQALAEDWEWLERQGYSREQAAQRLGVTRGYLNTVIARHQRALTRTDMETAA